MGLGLTERSMPCSVEAEQAVIGSVMIDPACVNKVLMAVTSQDFYTPQHQGIFRAIEQMAQAKTPLDPLTVLDRVKGDGVFDEANGRNYLFQMAQAVPSTANVVSYAAIVKEKAKARAAIALAEEIAEKLYIDGFSLNELQNLAGELLQIMSGTSRQKAFGSSQLLVRFEGRLNEPVRCVESGFAWLDRYAQMDFGDYVVVGGRPSSGKTALTLQLMLEMAKKNRVTYFSLETNPDKIFDRIVANRCAIDLRTIKRHELDKGERESVAVAMESYMDEWKFHVVAAAGWTVEQVRACALQLQSQVVFVDYLGLLSQSGKSLYERVTETSKGLHTMAQTTGITVVALSQLNRAGKGEDVEMEHLRESGQIEQDADIVLLISRPDEKNTRGATVPSNDKRNLHIAKNKDGESGKAVRLHFDGPTQRFWEIDEDR